MSDFDAIEALAQREQIAAAQEESDRRDLLALAEFITTETGRGRLAAPAIAAAISQRSLQIVSHAAVRADLTDFGQAGRDFINTTKFEMAAVAQGIELGAHVKIRAIDEFTRGLRPGRLYVNAGEPGVGKSAVWWIAALNYATAQANKSADKRMGVLVLSMEMGAQDSSTRFAQHLAGIDGEALQDGAVSQREMERLVEEWGKRREIPLYLNYAPNLKASQMIALVAEAIRAHNVGLVIVDHFRTFDLDVRLENKIDEDEEKARFLKEQIAREMNVAVVCLAHTRKPDSRSNPSGRPHMSDLRGSGQIAAHADMVSFIYRPILYVDSQKIDADEVKETDAEFIVRKNRQGAVGTGELYFDPTKMVIR